MSLAGGGQIARKNAGLQAVIHVIGQLNQFPGGQGRCGMGLQDYCVAGCDSRPDLMCNQIEGVIIGCDGKHHSDRQTEIMGSRLCPVF